MIGKIKPDAVAVSLTKVRRVHLLLASARLGLLCAP
jgi:hypothetical protein